MIRFFATAAWLCAMIGLGSAAQAQADANPDKILDSFKNICLATNGVRTAAFAATDQAGWKPSPESAEVRSGKSVDGAFSVMTIYNGTIAPDIAVPARTCFFSIKTARFSDIDAAVATIAGVSKQPGGKDGKDNYYSWREEGGRHIQVDVRSAEFKILFATGAVHFIRTIDISGLPSIAAAFPNLPN